MTWFRMLITTVMTIGLFTLLDGRAAAQNDATLELHWRDCGAAPPEDTSWFDHCHDGPWRASASEGTPATFVNNNTNEEFRGELDGNGDVVVSVPEGNYTFQHPPFHHANAHDFVCSYVDEQREPVQQLDDPAQINLAAGDHVICNFYVVWDGGAAGVMPLEPEDPQGIIEIRWRACTQATADEDWYSQCFNVDSEHGTESQESRRITVNDAENNTPWIGTLNEQGNTQIAVPPGAYNLPSITGDFVVADYLYCSIVDEDGDAVERDVESDPLSINNDMHIICDYYYVAE